MTALADRRDFIGDIARECGEKTALKFWEGTAGRYLFITSAQMVRAHGEDHWLAKLVGLDEAQKIAALLPMSMEIQIPMGPFSERAVRARRIRELILSGASVNTVAVAMNCHRRTVSANRAKLRKEGLL